MRKNSRGNIFRRLEVLESKLTDQSRLVPHSPEWLAYWDRELYNYFTGQPHVPLIFAGVRAVLQVWGDPGFLVSTLPDEDEETGQAEAHVPQSSHPG